jgi:hypothetical protein
MNDPIAEHQWDVRMAHYDRLLHSMMELIQGTVKIMRLDGLSETIEELRKAFLAIEDAWATVSLEWTSSLVTSEETEGDVEREGSKWPGN